jgi:hypothetical protein
MDAFDAAIADFVRQEQYRKETFEIELFPRADQFVFQKGQKIGTMGTSGRSFGPHLHFEIRDTKTEKPINPLLFGFKVEDTRKPRMHQLKLYGIDANGETILTNTYSVKDRGGRRYRISGDTISVKAPTVGAALKVYDHMNGVSNWNGIYQLAMYVDDSLHYQFDMETFAFSESRYINAHLDYEEQVTKKSYFNRCYMMPGNELSIYNQMVDRGLVQLRRDQTRKIELIATDIEGNEAKLQFWIKQHQATPPSHEVPYTYVLPHQEKSVIETADMRLFFPKGTLYEDLFLNYTKADDRSNGVYSAVHHIHDYKTPVHKYYNLSLFPANLPESLRSKAFIAYCTKDNKVINCGGEWKAGWLTTKVRDLGDFYIAVDQKKPTILPGNYRRDMRGKRRMTFTIQDDIATARNVQGLRYKATIDGQWVLMQFDAKNNLLFHEFESSLAKGEHQLQLEVWDAIGNKRVFESTFLK